MRRSNSRGDSEPAAMRSGSKYPSSGASSTASVAKNPSVKVMASESSVYSNAPMPRSDRRRMRDRRDAADATSVPIDSMASDSSSTSTMPVGVNAIGCSGFAARTSVIRWRKRDDDNHAVMTAISRPTTSDATNTAVRFRARAFDAENSSSSRSRPTRAQCSLANGDVLSYSLISVAPAMARSSEDEASAGFTTMDPLSPTDAVNEPSSR